MHRHSGACAGRLATPARVALLWRSRSSVSGGAHEPGLSEREALLRVTTGSGTAIWGPRRTLAHARPSRSRLLEAAARGAGN